MRKIACWLLLAAVGCTSEKPSSTPQSSTTATSATTNANRTDQQFVAKPTPAEAVSAWVEAIREKGAELHAPFALNEKASAEPHWKTTIDEVVNAIRDNAFVTSEPIIDGDLAVMPVKGAGELDHVCLVKIQQGWCVLESLADWTALGDAPDRSDAMQSINLKMLEMQLNTK